ncbi:MAG: hypothetical protein H6729_17455 [Deltaproteobacteria bacterium]|nr:hypothetical protein [Deltaproteobacteria bacterium]
MRSDDSPRRFPTPYRERGFALIVVVLIVALLAVAAVTLLDIVNIDINFTGQKRVRLLADSNAQGAMMEVVTDEQISRSLPDYSFTDQRHVWAQGNTKYPVGAPSVPLDSSNSAFVRNIGSPLEETYDADIRLLKYGPVQDTGVDTARALIYEVSTRADVHDDKASREARTEVFLFQPVQSGQRIAPRHAR